MPRQGVSALVRIWRGGVIRLCNVRMCAQMTYHPYAFSHALLHLGTRATVCGSVQPPPLPARAPGRRAAMPAGMPRVDGSHSIWEVSG